MSKKDNYYCVIMAGGVGTRFWPMSLNERPKQFHDVMDSGQTFLEETYQRALSLVPKENVYIVTCAEYKNLVQEQLGEIKSDQIILEPMGRDTAPCNIYAALKINQLNPEALLLVLPSDHLIKQPDKFIENVIFALEKSAEEDRLITIGIKPTNPNTGYGYIQYLTEDTNRLKKVKTFTEKPTKEFAQNFIDSGDFLWNSGMFVWSTKSIIKAFSIFLPEMYDSLVKVDYNTDKEAEQIAKVYPTLQKISIDYGIMENAENTYIIPSDFGWSDVGTWTSLYDESAKDENGNVLLGKNIRSYNLEGTIIKNTEDKLIVIDGLEDYIVVNTANALLICPKGKDQKVKNYVNDLKLNKLEDFV